MNLAAFCRRENLGAERVRNLLQVTQIYVNEIMVAGLGDLILGHIPELLLSQPPRARSPTTAGLDPFNILVFF